MKPPKPRPPSPTDQPDYYEILGVAPDASEAEIKSSFRKRAKECHPDHNPGDQTACADFQELKRAFTVLHDETARHAYDEECEARARAREQVKTEVERGEILTGTSGPGDLWDLAPASIQFHPAIHNSPAPRSRSPRRGTCPACHGRGVIHRVVWTPRGPITRFFPCPRCSRW